MIFQDKGSIVAFNLDEMPKDFWLTLEPDYALPSGTIGRIYSSEYHKLWINSSEQAEAEHPWTEGDRYLANAESYVREWRRSQGEIVPDLGAFRIAMLSDNAYNRIASIVPAHIIASLAAAIVVSPIHYPSLIQVWNLIITSLPPEMRPTEAEIGIWQGYASTAQIPISFTSAGLLTI